MFLQPAHIWLKEPKKPPPSRLFLIEGFPGVQECFSCVSCAVFCPHRLRRGPCCWRTAVTLTSLTLVSVPLLRVWSPLKNVHTDGMWRAESQHLKTCRTCHNNLGKQTRWPQDPSCEREQSRTTRSTPTDPLTLHQIWFKLHFLNICLPYFPKHLKKCFICGLKGTFVHMMSQYLTSLTSGTACPVGRPGLFLSSFVLSGQK